MKNVKKTQVIFEAIAIVMLIVSVATAVPQVQSEPVMDKLEQIEKANNLQVTQETNKLVLEEINNFSEIINSINIQEFSSYFTSIEFANLFMNSEIQNFLNSQTYSNFYNNGSVQTFLNSNQFAAFMNTAIAQQFLANINGGGGNSNPQSQRTSLVVGQAVAAPSNNVAIRKTSTSNVMAGQNVVVGVKGATANGGQSVQINALQQQTNKFNLFAGLLVGLIHWSYGELPPGGLIGLIILVTLLILTIMTIVLYTIILVVFWILIWLIAG